MKKTTETNKVMNYISTVDLINGCYNKDLISIAKKQEHLKESSKILEKEKQAFKYDFQNKAFNLERYSTFNIEQICPFMANIIGLLCGEEYTWEFLNYNVDSQININKIIFHSVNKNPLTDNMDSNKIFTMNYNDIKKEITFFNTVTDLKSKTCGLKLTRPDILEKIPLLGVFIDMLVESRLKDKLVRVTDNELMRVQYYFLTLYKEEIKAQYIQSKKKIKII